MGQVQSSADTYNCAHLAPEDTSGARMGRARQKKEVGSSSGVEKATISNKVPRWAQRPALSGDGKRQKMAPGGDGAEHLRKLSIVSNRNIQLLSMKTRTERDNYADGLKSRRRSSLINMILGAPSSGPRFSDDLCSLNSHMSELVQNFGIDYFPDPVHGLQQYSTNSSLARLEDGSYPSYQAAPAARHNSQSAEANQRRHHRRRSSLGSLASFKASCALAEAERNESEYKPSHAEASKGSIQQSKPDEDSPRAPESVAKPAVSARHQRRPSLSSIFLASIDLTSSRDESAGACDTGTKGRVASRQNDRIGGKRAPSLVKSRRAILGHGDVSSESGCSNESQTSTSISDRGTSPAAGMPAKEHINQVGARRMLHRSGSELSLYSSVSGNSSGLSHHQLFQHHQLEHAHQQSLPITLPASASASLASTLHGRRTSHLSSNPSVIMDSCCGVGGGSLKRKLPHLGKSGDEEASALARETKLIIMLQVCLPFILAGFGNMAAGLVLNKVAQWRVFQRMPIFFVLLPSFIGMKGNIEMTLASRLSTLANLNLLATSYQRRHAFLSNLILILSQAMGLSLFAAFASMMCEFMMGKLELGFSETLYVTSLVVLPCALITSAVLVFISSIVMWLSIWLANLIQVNPDNLSTLLAALYGDVTCVLMYGLFADIMYSFHQRNILLWPVAIISIATASWPVLWYMAFKFKETHQLALSSMPPMLTGIMVSLGSGTILSLVVGRYSRIALYQPVVNGFGANLIAVQASRVSTWLWCTALRRLSLETSSETTDISTQKASAKLGASLVPYTNQLTDKQANGQVGADEGKESGRLHQLVLSRLSRALQFGLKIIKTLLWSFVNPSPNSVAARLLLIMLIPAHTLYFFVIWLLSPTNYVVLTWPFYTIYILLCLSQVFILLLICEPLMTLLMRRHLDPDIFGISLLMALADLIGTLCLTGAFMLLASVGDPNAL